MEGDLNDGTGAGSDTGPQICALLTDGAGDGRALHFTLGVDNDTSVVLKVDEDTIATAPGLALTDDDSGHNLLSQLRLSLLDSGHDHVADTTSGQLVKTTLDTLDGDNVQVLGARVVSAVHDGANRQTQGHTELVSGRSAT